MKGIDKSLIEFHLEDRDEVHIAMRQLQLAADGWVNIEPIVSTEDLEGLAEPGLLRIFSSKGPRIPFATYVPGDTDDLKPRMASVGLQHSAGPNVISVLAERGVVPPLHWVKRDESSKRGLVLEMAAPESVEVILDFVLRAGTAVAGVPMRGFWTALVHRPTV